MHWIISELGFRRGVVLLPHLFLCFLSVYFFLFMDASAWARVKL